MARTATATPVLDKAAALAALGIDASKLAALQSLGLLNPTDTVQPKATATAKAKPEPVVVKTQTEIIAADLGGKNLDYTQGRVYFTTELVESMARIARKRTAGYEIVTSAKEGTRVAAVLVVHDEDGKTYAQNLRAI